MGGPQSRLGGGTSAEDPGTGEDLIGTVLPGRFRIDAVIARGGFGTVYRAHQLTVGRDVAVKVLHATIDAESRAVRLFVQEIQAVGRLDHAHVVRIFQADTTADGRLFYAMELLAGRDLDGVLREDGPIAATRAIDLTRQLLVGLAAIHDAGLVHADVKPANAIVVRGATAERVVLVDFGLARLRPIGAAARSAGGTPAFMAPEQLTDGRVDARSDVFAAGLIAVALLTGWERRMEDDLVPPLDLITDGALRDVLARALALAPSARYQSARDLAAALAAIGRNVEPVAIVDGASVTRGVLDEPPVTPMAVEASHSVTSGRGTWLAAVAVVLVVGLGGVAVWQSRSSATPPVVVTAKGSGSVLRGVLGPLRALVERRTGVHLPVDASQDSGSSNAMKLLWNNDSDLALRSERWTDPVPTEAAVGRVVVEVAVAIDEMGVYVHRARSLDQLDAEAFRSALCCDVGAPTRSPVWSDLGVSGGPVVWLLYGRDEPLGAGIRSSATLLQADEWLCPGAHLCPSIDPRLGEAHHVLSALAQTPDGLAVSSRATSNRDVRAVPLVDRARHARFDGRRPLWIYAVAPPDEPLSPATCAVIGALLSDEAAAALDNAALALPLPTALRARERTWLGLDDDTCAERRVAELAVDARGVAVTPVAGDLVFDHWPAE